MKLYIYFWKKNLFTKKIKNKIKCTIIVDDNFGFLFKMCLVIIFKSIFFTIWNIKIFKFFKIIIKFIFICFEMYGHLYSLSINQIKYVKYFIIKEY